jgi:hypothetical protein
MALFHTTVLDNQIKALPTVDTASGSVATFDTDMTENLVEVKCQIVAQQSGSGTPSPDNERPIQTYTEMNVSHTGKNLLENTATSTTINVAFTIQSDKSVLAVGSNTSQTIFKIGELTAPKNMTIKYGGVSGGSSSTYSINLRKNGGTYLGDIYDGFSNEISVNKGDILEYLIVVRPNYTINTMFYPMIVFGSETDLTYEPFNGTTANIPFGQTVANGVINVTTGKLRVTDVDVDMGSLTWYKAGNADIFYSLGLGGNNNASEMLCEIYDYGGAFSGNDVAYAAGNLKVSVYTGSDHRIYIRDDDCWSMSTSDFANYLSGKKLVYELATPIEIQLDSTQISALLNENNIWCDTGDTEVKFLLSVGKKIS